MFTTKDTEENKFKGRPEHTEVAESTEAAARIAPAVALR
jgi:hypothetical protein